MCLSDFLRSQFGSPSGPFGSLFVAPFLNFINLNLIRSTVDLLHPQPDDRVLDIGFGGGYSLLALARRVPRGRLVSVALPLPTGGCCRPSHSAEEAASEGPRAPGQCRQPALCRRHVR